MLMDLEPDHGQRPRGTYWTPSGPSWLQFGPIGPHRPLLAPSGPYWPLLDPIASYWLLVGPIGLLIGSYWALFDPLRANVSWSTSRHTRRSSTECLCVGLGLKHVVEIESPIFRVWVLVYSGSVFGIFRVWVWQNHGLNFGIFRV